MNAITLNDNGTSWGNCIMISNSGHSPALFLEWIADNKHEVRAVEVHEKGDRFKIKFHPSKSANMECASYINANLTQ